MMNVIFVNCIEFSRDYRDLPLGIMSLASVCNFEEDINASIVDFGSLYSSGKLTMFSDLDDNIEEMSDYLLAIDPDIVSFYGLCSSYHLSVMLSKRLKIKNPNIVILFGGPHASLTAVETLRAFSWIDYIGVDEGEQTIVPLLRGALKRSVTSLYGVAFRDEVNSYKVIKNPAPICNVDDLPMIDYSLEGIQLSSSVPIDVGRGCPFGCIYCSTKTFWKQRFRLKSIERIISEINILIRRNGVTNFAFVHDLFTVNRRTIFDFCKQLVERDIKITWSCSARLDTLSDELLDVMYNAGCRRIYLGIESGSQRIQKIINKNLNLSLIENLITYIQKYNIEFTCSFIYGFPEESVKDLESTLSVIKIIWEAGVQTVQLHKATFLPGTEMYKRHYNKLKYNNLCTDFTEQSYINEEAIGYITQNKEIFPQFYTTQSVATLFPYLDIFVLYFYPTISSYMPTTNVILSELLGDGILPLYISFQNVVPDSFEKIVSVGGAFIEKIYRTGRIFNIIGTYLERFLRPNRAASYEIALFEMDAVRFLRSNDVSLTKDYSFDVLALVAAGGACLDADIHEISVLFSKSDKETVIVKYNNTESKK